MEVRDVEDGVAQLIFPGCTFHAEQAQAAEAAESDVHFVGGDAEHAGDPARIGLEIVEAGEFENSEVAPVIKEFSSVAGKESGCVGGGVLGAGGFRGDVLLHGIGREPEAEAEFFDDGAGDGAFAAEDLGEGGVVYAEIGGEGAEGVLFVAGAAAGEFLAEVTAEGGGRGTGVHSGFHKD